MSDLRQQQWLLPCLTIAILKIRIFYSRTSYKSYYLITMHPAKRSVKNGIKKYLYMLARSRSSRQQAVVLVPCFYPYQRIIFCHVFRADLCLLHTGRFSDVSVSSQHVMGLRSPLPSSPPRNALITLSLVSLLIPFSFTPSPRAAPHSF